MSDENEDSMKDFLDRFKKQFNSQWGNKPSENKEKKEEPKKEESKKSNLDFRDELKIPKLWELTKKKETSDQKNSDTKREQ